MIMAAESFFTKVANDVLEATEKISKELDESFGALFSGGGAGTEQPPTPPTAVDDQPDMEWDAEAEQEFLNSPLQGIADSVLGDIMQGQNSPKGPIEHFQAFRHAISWSEPFVLSLVAFHVVMFFLCVWVSRKSRGLTPRIGVMVFIAVLVRMAERLNGIAARHWQSFATQNYFDQKGIFVSIMLCTPLLFDSLVMLLIYLREASQLLVQVKTHQIKKQRKQAKEAQQPSEKESNRGSKKDQ